MAKRDKQASSGGSAAVPDPVAGDDAGAPAEPGAQPAPAAKAKSKAPKAAKARKAEKAAKPPKAEKAAKPPKAEKAAKPPKAEKAAGKSAKTPKAEKAPKAGKKAKDKGKVAAQPANLVGQASSLAAAAGAILGEVAGLVRQAAEPAAARIVEMVARPTTPVVEPEPEAESTEPGPVEPEPEPVSDGAEVAVAAPDAPEAAELDQEAPAAAPEAEAAAAEPETAPEADADATATPPLEIQPGAVIAAAIDVGATSVHLLVAAVGNHRVVPILDESAFLGLGDRVTADGRLGPATRGELTETLAGYADAARQLNAGPITVVGTEPLRRADDAAVAIHEASARAGVPFHVVDHDEEGLLTLLGVTGGRPIQEAILVVDIGGGSSEIVVVEPDGSVSAGGLPLGAARLTQELVRSDPPSLAEIDALRARTREVVADLPDLRPTEIVAVGGTASNLLKLLPATAIDRMLTRRRITVALAMLTVERSAEAASRHLIRPERARILPAGALIVDAILERFGVDRLRVSEEGIRSGLLLATSAAGGAWRDRLPRLAGGWDESPLD